MDVNYQALIAEKERLAKLFNQANKTLQELEASYKKVTSASTWNSLAKTYYSEKIKKLESNFDIVNDQFRNIQNYLETVIDNYQQVERDLINSFSKFK